MALLSLGSRVEEISRCRFLSWRNSFSQLKAKPSWPTTSIPTSPTFPTGIDEQQERKLSCIFTLSLKNHNQLPYLIRHHRKAAPGNSPLLTVLLHLLLIQKLSTLPSKAELGGESREEACQACIRVFVAPSRHLHLRAPSRQFFPQKF